MIENISTEGLQDESYKKIMKEIESLRNKQLEHKSELTKLGTGSSFYSHIDLLLFRFKHNSILRLPALLLLKIIRNFLASIGKILVPYTNVIWVGDYILNSTLPAPPRHVEYPWSIRHANLDRPMKILDVGSGA